MAKRQPKPVFDQDTMEWTATITRFKDGRLISRVEGSDDLSEVANDFYSMAQNYGFDIDQYRALQLKHYFEMKANLKLFALAILEILK